MVCRTTYGLLAFTDKENASGGLLDYSGPLPGLKQTKNLAEYSAVIRCIATAKKLNPKQPVMIFTASS